MEIDNMKDSNFQGPTSYWIETERTANSKDQQAIG